jgi:hypothetical protein
MHCHLYLRKGTVFVPTQGVVHKGLHRDIEPVDVVPASDADGIRRALHATIARATRRRVLIRAPFPRQSY